MDIDRTKYITLEEASDMLEIVGTYSAKISSLKALNVNHIKLDRNKNFYLKQDIENAREEVLKFFEEYCTPDEYGLKDAFVKKKGLKSIPVPPGYNSMFYKRRYDDADFKMHRNCYKRSELMKLKNDCNSRKETKSELSEKYVLTCEAIERLGLDTIPESSASRILKMLGVNKFTHSDGNKFVGYCEKETLNIAIKTMNAFYSEYCVIDECDLPSKYIEKNLESYPMPKGYNYVFYKARLGTVENKLYKVVYRKKDIELLKIGILPSSNEEKAKTKSKPTKRVITQVVADHDQYIALLDAEKMLGCGRVRLKKIREICDFREAKIDGKLHIEKKSIDEFIDKRDAFYKEYITAPDITAEYLNGSTNRAIIPKLPRHEVPPQFVTIDNASSVSKVGIFKRKEVEEYLESINYRDITISDITGDTHFDTFMSRLDYFYNWDEFSENSKFTSELWFKHVKKVLEKSGCNESVMSSKINAYIQCTLLLKELLERNNKPEIYMIKTSEINLFQKGVLAITQKTYLYYFYREVYQEIVSSYSGNKIAYKISLVDKPPRDNKKDNDSKDEKSDIYEFETYAEVFQYQLKIEHHVEKSLNEILNTGTATYASTWLYIMLHLNNAWRNGDVRDFPSIDIDDLLLSFDIDSLEWFKCNTLSLPKARGIISRIIQWEISISKTKMEGHFFCSDELAPALATAIIMLTLYKKEQGVIEDDKLIHFNTRYNKISQGLLNIFFEELEVNGFKFKSKKFNKTVMTYITYLANLSGDKKALEYAKYMRSHTRISSTLHYIDFDVKAVEKLSELLFARGEFGYVTSLLLTKLNGGEVLDFEESTEQIYVVNQMFGDVSKMSMSVGFLNTIRGDRASVAKCIAEKSFEECQDIYTELFARKLPSKEGSDIQCLFSKKGCQKPGLPCLDCCYHIPTIYTLTSLCEVLLSDIRLYNSTSSVPKRYKLALSIHRKKLDLSEAVKKFGSEYVFHCLGIDKGTFIEILSDIPNPMQISNN